MSSPPPSPPPASRLWLSKFSSSIGFEALWGSTRDMKLLIVLRMVRLFGCGGVTLILALYLSSQGIADTAIGLFMTLTLIGDLLISMILTYIGDSLGVRLTIAIGAVLMSLSGVAFAYFDNYWLLLAASILGVINPSANEVDPFKAIEESAIARLSTPDNCSDFFAWWSLLGMLGTATSTLVTGFVVDRLQYDLGLTIIEAYNIIFLGYAVVGLVKLFCSFCLSREVELVIGIEYDRLSICSEQDDHPDEETPLLADSDSPRIVATTVDYGTSKGPPSDSSLDDVEDKPDIARQSIFTPESFSFMWKLCLAMGLDFIGSGLAQISWMTYFFKREFDVAEGPLGLAIFIASLTSSFLNLASLPLSRAIGQVPTMIVCHTINSLSLLLISVPNRTLALLLLIFRIVTRELDNAPRQAFISHGVLPEERTSAMGAINVVKTVGSCIGLYVTGQFAASSKFWVTFMVAGGLKLGYNLCMVVFFWRHKPRT